MGKRKVRERGNDRPQGGMDNGTIVKAIGRTSIDLSSAIRKIRAAIMDFKMAVATLNVATTSNRFFIVENKSDRIMQ